MKFFRAIAMVLILALASNPALAAVCATSYASKALISSLHSESMPVMKNCHDNSMKKDKSKSNADHKSCTMGAGCHFTQLTSPIASSTKVILVDSTTITFPKFSPFAKSIDLSPPLKPPA